MYVIKHTYTETGKQFLLVKGGYVRGLEDILLSSDGYAKRQTAQAIATKYAKENEWNKDHMPSIYEAGTYEVIEV